MDSRRTLTFLNAGHFLIHYFMLIFPTAIIAIQQDWGLRYGDALWLGSSCFAAFAIATLPFGWLGDRVGRHLLLSVFFLGCGTSSIAVGLAANSTALVVGLTGIGFFAAIYHPVGLALLTDLAARKGRAIAINGVYGNLGLAEAALITGWLSAGFGWRTAFIVPGSMSILVGLIFGFVVPRQPRRGETGGKSADPTPITGWSQRRVLAVVMLSALFGGCIFNGVTVSLPKIFQVRLGGSASSVSDVGTYVALVFAVAAFAQLPVGALLDRYGARPILLVLLTVQAVALLAASVAAGPALIATSLVLVTGIFAEIPVTSWLLGQYVGSHWRARAYAAEYVLSLGISAAIVPLIALLHNRGFGFAGLYQALVVAAVIVLAAAVFLPAFQRQPTARNPGAAQAAHPKKTAAELPPRR